MPYLILSTELLEAELQAINEEMSRSFNPNFGSIFRTHGRSTLFAFSLRRYVDLYMSRVGALLHYSPSHRFYPSHSIRMAHDPKTEQ
jgi:5' nucleotidase family